MNVSYTRLPMQDKCAAPFRAWIVLLGFVLAPPADAKPKTAKALFQQAERAFFGRTGQKAQNDAAQDYEKACGKRFWPACWRLARLLEAQPTLEDSLPKAALQGKSRILALDRKACERGYGESCAALGLRYDAGQGVPTDKAQALAFFTQACKKKSGQGCYALYLRKQGGKLSEVSPQTPLLSEALQYLRKGCQAKFGRDCFLLGYLAYTQKPPILPLEQALSFFRQGCRARDPEACDFAGLLFGNAIGTKQDLFQARMHHREACELASPDGCLHYAGMLLRGLGGDRDLAQARSLFSRLCQAHNSGQGCLLLAEMQLRGEGGDKDVKGAMHTYERACHFKQDIGCQRHRSMKRILGSDASEAP